MGATHKLQTNKETISTRIKDSVTECAVAYIIIIIRYNTTLLSLSREICLQARHLHKTFNTFIKNSTKHGAKNRSLHKRMT